MRITNLLIACVVIANQATATNYYLSEKGSDLQRGTSKLTPWHSLKKLSEVMQSLLPGDSILFERGSVFKGELKITASGKVDNGIYVGAYGWGAKPIISGSKEIKNWTLFRGNIWVAECTDCNEEPGNLFLDGRFQPLGRYPNDGYLTLSCDSKCQATFNDSHHAFPDNYWNGCEVVVKSSRWTLDNLPVSSYFNKAFYFSVEASYPLQNGYGYFIQKHLATLDRPGEWFFDRASKKIFFYSKSDDKPGNHVIEVSIVDTGLNLMNVNFVTIENISFRYQRLSGARVKNSNNILLCNCDIEYSGANGVEMSFCKNPTVENCRIENSNNNGVEWRDNSNGSFVKNSIHRTGLRPGRGWSANGTYVGLSIAADNPHLGKNLFQYNSIDSTGYIGIDFRTGDTSVKNNTVSNFCMTKDDGAGIYTWGNSFGGNTVDGNIVLRGVGNGEGTNDPDQVWVHGIYIDDRSSDINVSNNTIAYCSSTGIYIHNAKRISIQGNTLFANGNRPANKENGQLLIKLDAIVPDGDKKLNLQVTENRFVTLQESNHCISLRAEKGQDLNSLGLFDRNQYSAPRANQVIARLYGHSDICDAISQVIAKVYNHTSSCDEIELTLFDWQQCTGNDKSSQFKMLDYVQYDSHGTNLIKNGSMTVSTEGWITWPSEVFIVHDKRKGEDGPSLKVQFPSGKQEALLYHAGFSLNSSKTYRLSFSAMSTVNSKMEFVPLMASYPWGALGNYACFPIDTSFKSFTCTFKPSMSCKEARVNFKSNTTFWIDNVTLFEVVPKSNGEGELLKLIYNASDKSRAIPLNGNFTDLAGNQLSSPLALQGYGSVILLKH